ncbi:MAG: phosphate uptake regulator PhoU [Candidatus Micrarchaeia archaeon]
MEMRKVQKSGNSSFVVSLPSGWVKAQGIRKNAPVSVGQNSDGSLTILARATPEKSAAPMILRVSGKEKKSVLFRKMVAAYIAGCQRIDVIPAPGQFDSALELVSEYTSSTVGQEVVEETENMISVKDVLNPAELPMGKVTQRMHAVCRKMVGAAVISLGGGRPAGLNMEIMERDIDRLLWLAARKHHQFLRFPSLAAAEGITLAESHLLFMSARYMERIADHAFSIYGDKTKSGRLHEFGKFAENQYSGASRALFEKNMVLAHQVIEDVISRKAPSGGMKNRSFTAVEASSSASIRRIAEYSAGMCENLIDFAASQGQ